MCKQILSVPALSNHGETLSMKGLILSSLGKKDEALEHAKLGLKYNIKSHVCWNVFGLLQKNEKKYEEALKCYKNALKFDKENLQVLRDLSSLQVQLRDYDGFKETRYKILQLKTSQKYSWIGYCFALYLCGEYSSSNLLIEEFKKNRVINTQSERELNEILLFQVFLLLKMKKNDEALNFMDINATNIIDKCSLLALKASILDNLNKKDQAILLYRKLLSRNPDNIDYFYKIQQALNIADFSIEQHNLFEYYLNIYPTSNIFPYEKLRFIQGKDEKFCDYVKEVLINGFKRALPNLFRLIKVLYSDTDKVGVIEKIIKDYLHFIQEKNETSMLIWVEFFLAQHYYMVNKLDLALKIIENIIIKTPTFIDAYIIKAKIYKKSGRSKMAAKILDDCRLLDTSDKFINCKTNKYLLKAGNSKQAIENASLFIKEKDTLESIHDIQCTWFELCLASCHLKNGQYDQCLEMCHYVKNHFDDIVDDQFDFHTYCFRRSSLDSHAKLVNFEKDPDNHSLFYKASIIALKCYIHLDILKKDGSLTKVLSKFQKDNKNQKPTKLYDGNELILVDDFLSAATPFLDVLRKYFTNKFKTLVVLFEYYLLKEKYLMVSSCYLKMEVFCKSVDPTNSSYLFYQAMCHYYKIIYLYHITKNMDSFCPPVKSVILKNDKLLQSFDKENKLIEYIVSSTKQLIETFKTSAITWSIGYKVNHFLTNMSICNDLKFDQTWLINQFNSSNSLSQLSIKECKIIYKILVKTMSDEHLNEIIKIFQKIYNEADIF